MSRTARQIGFLVALTIPLMVGAGCSREAADSLEVFGEGQANQVGGQRTTGNSVGTPLQFSVGVDADREAVPLPNPLGLLGLDLATSDCDIRIDPYDTCM